MRLAFALAAALAANSTHAAPQLDCQNPQSNLEMKLCAQQEFERADAELNRVYGKVLAAARQQYRSLRAEKGYDKMPDSEDLLRKAQRAWLAFRDANCAYHYQIYYGGSHASLAYGLCKSDMTKARVAELKAISSDGEETEAQP